MILEIGGRDSHSEQQSGKYTCLISEREGEFASMVVATCRQSDSDSEYLVICARVVPCNPGFSRKIQQTFQ